MQKVCKTSARVWSLALSLALAGGLSACGGDDDRGHDHEDENEVISRVELSFTPTGGGEPLVFAFTDPDGDGGVSGVADRVELAAGVEYELAVRFINSIADPPEDISGEIEAEAEDHFIFVTGDVSGPASSTSPALVKHAYADHESDYGENAVGDDLPVGLANKITGGVAGSGELRVILRHLPPLNDLPQKTAELPADLAAGRDLPGSVDADITFELVVS
ncbi:MAG: hypothetical protein H0T76_11585 [Nannocystis sp.]|nr:hypothetical protein [Nannocystis sp.]MBA3547117.1 hypothetical protein [Nannocystis sp.]